MYRNTEPETMQESICKTISAHESKQKYSDLRFSGKPTESLGIRANSCYLAFPWETGGGGTLALIPRDIFGRITEPLMFKGHAGAVLDVEFSPFYESMFLTASEDGSAKLWEAPLNAPMKKLKDPICQLKGHTKKVMFVSFNPVADFVAASASMDGFLKIWNVEEQAEYTQLLCDKPTHLKWNYDGRLVATVSKDKRLRVFDPRSSGYAAVQDLEAHQGVRAIKCEWIDGSRGSEHTLLTTGFSKYAEREIKIWDIRKASVPVSTTTVDKGSSSIFPMWDEACGLLYCWGRGDGNMRVLSATPCGALVKVEEYRSTVPSKGVCLLPQRYVDVLKFEIGRLYKAEGNGVIQPISLNVRRQGVGTFDQNIFPDCYAGQAALSCNQWMDGETASPIRKSQDPEKHAADTPLTVASKQQATAQRRKLRKGTTTTALSHARGVLEKDLQTAQNHIAEVLFML
eukprot:GHVQ01018690.1.p1 GENE.GHVQ01018690.1~~GHVQ01018690.1.p1  ORF type:complete len:457 (-),score=55.61 GHVQ01018690.1:1127-2497(-)